MSNWINSPANPSNPTSPMNPMNQIGHSEKLTLIDVLLSLGIAGLICVFIIVVVYIITK